MSQQEVTIFVARPFDEFSGKFSDYLQTTAAPAVAQKLKAEHDLVRSIRFVDAEEPHADRTISQKIAEKIRASDLFLALCFPKSVPSDTAGATVPAWVNAELGYAYSQGKPTRVIFIPPVSPLSIPFQPGDLEQLNLPSRELEMTATAAWVESAHTWLAEWVATNEKVMRDLPPYKFLRYDKNVVVHPDGYGCVTASIEVEIQRAGAAEIPHFFQALSPRKTAFPKFKSMQDNFVKKQSKGATGREDVFAFACCSADEGEAGSLRCAVSKWSDMPEHIKAKFKKDTPRIAYFKILPSKERGVIAPGRYKYEFLYGLENLFEPHFGKDSTTASPSPAHVLDGSLSIEFRCATDEDLKRARNLEVSYLPGGGGARVSARAAARRNEPGVAIVRNSRGLVYEFNGLLAPFPDDQVRLSVQW